MAEVATLGQAGPGTSGPAVPAGLLAAELSAACSMQDVASGSQGMLQGRLQGRLFEFGEVARLVRLARKIQGGHNLSEVIRIKKG